VKVGLRGHISNARKEEEDMGNTDVLNNHKKRQRLESSLH
jgi:hypothetical protein